MGDIIYHRRHGGYRSLFWPIILIGIGVLWLLGNLSIISAQNLVVLARIWPLILIIVGLDLLFGRRSPMTGAVIGIGTVVLLVLLMLIGPSVGLGYDLKEVTLNDSVPVGDATSARVVVSINTGKGVVKAAADSKALVDYNIQALGEVDATVEGQAEKTITLKQRNQNMDGMVAWLAGAFQQNDKYTWNVDLSPNVPVDLNFTNGTGEADLDLTNVKLESLSLNVGTGSVKVQLPKTEQKYSAEVSSGTGGGELVIADGAAVDLNLSAGTGGFTVDVPDNAAVRLEGSTGVGSISVPSNFKRVSGGDKNVVGERGTWETENFSTADTNKITITFSGGTGGLTVK